MRPSDDTDTHHDSKVTDGRSGTSSNLFASDRKIQEEPGAPMVAAARNRRVRNPETVADETSKPRTEDHSPGDGESPDWVKIAQGAIDAETEEITEQLTVKEAHRVWGGEIGVSDQSVPSQSGGDGLGPSHRSAHTGLTAGGRTVAGGVDTSRLVDTGSGFDAFVEEPPNHALTDSVASRSSSLLPSAPGRATSNKRDARPMYARLNDRLGLVALLLLLLALGVAAVILLLNRTDDASSSTDSATDSQSEQQVSEDDETRDPSVAQIGLGDASRGIAVTTSTSGPSADGVLEIMVRVSNTGSEDVTLKRDDFDLAGPDGPYLARDSDEFTQTSLGRGDEMATTMSWAVPGDAPGAELRISAEDIPVRAVTVF